MIPNELLSAYLDGELEPEEMERVRRAVESDELLAARLRKFREADRLVADFASGIDAEPLPRALRERLGIGAEGAEASVAAARSAGAPAERNASRLHRWRLPAAMAAALTVALFAGLRMGSHDDGGQFELLVQLGPVPATSPLALALERVASDTTTADAGVRITPQLSFLSSREGVCREYRVDGTERAARGLACRSDAGWRALRVTATALSADTDAGYQTASGGTDAGFDAFVDALIDTGPLAPEEEAALMRRGWRID